MIKNAPVQTQFEFPFLKIFKFIQVVLQVFKFIQIITLIKLPFLLLQLKQQIIFLQGPKPAFFLQQDQHPDIPVSQINRTVLQTCGSDSASQPSESESADRISSIQHAETKILLWETA